MRQVVIVGAGLAGLTAGYLLSDKGYRVTVLEKEDRVGGLARSFYYDGFIFDIGPHRFHTDDEVVQKFIEKILGEERIVLPRSSGVWMFGHYHDWPLNWKVLFRLPPSIIARTIPDLFFKDAQKGNSFEDYIISRYGKTLYEVFFKPYTEKFLKLAPSDVHHHWAETGIDRAIIDKKVQMGSLFEVVKTALIPRSVKTNFLYPSDGGIDVFSRKLANGITKSGGEVVLNATVETIERQGPTITSLRFQDKQVRPDILIWTAPLTTLMNLLNLPPSNLRYLSIVIFNIETRGAPSTKYQWCYFGQEDTTISRVSVPTLFSRRAAPEGKTGICAEVTCFEGDEVWANPESLVDTVVDDLLKVRTISSKEDLENIHIERILNTYPVYDLAYPENLQQVLREVGKFKELKLLGRTGTFWYNNMDHSIRMAFDLASNILSDTRDSS